MNLNNVELLNFERDSFDQLIAWANEPEILMQFAGPDFVFPLTRKQLEKSINEPLRRSFAVRLNSTMQIIGHAEIYLNNDNAHLCRILIGEESMRGKGIGQQIVQELLRMSFQELNCKNASLNVYDWNTMAINCYTRAGFQVSDEPKNSSEISGETWVSSKMILNRERWESVRAINGIL